jgi:hypothetical protein
MQLKRKDELPEEIYKVYKDNDDLDQINKIIYTLGGAYLVYFDITYDEWTKVNGVWNYEVKYR